MNPEIKKILKKLFWQVVIGGFLLALVGFVSFILKDPNLQEIAQEVAYYLLILALIIMLPLGLIFFLILHGRE